MSVLVCVCVRESVGECACVYVCVGERERECAHLIKGAVFARQRCDKVAELNRKTLLLLKNLEIKRRESQKMFESSRCELKVGHKFGRNEI